MDITTKPPAAPTGRETRDALLKRTIRSAVPLRKTFVQKEPGQEPRHGPLHVFVKNKDLRGLRAYLMVVAASSGENDDGWTTSLDSLVWARLLDAHETATEQSARTAAWRALGRLEDRRLIRRARGRRVTDIQVTLLREDGSGDTYTRPGIADKDRYLQLPVAFWRRGWDAKLDLPAMAMLLTVAREKPWSTFPGSMMQRWYGWSEDTAQRGLTALREHRLLERREHYELRPLSPTGSSLMYQYRLARWLRPAPKQRPEHLQAGA
ncbi:hypothetical protein [Nonomuraea endophytica]|uniref:Uncharacterized protein n=1 Tax=Nonomuraea endophytica TaxID=714136 RepID=A0A7W8A0W7_9ACTN|nr:hypothetical protein [Nonomuraea endophytica]MBB5077506.1 hypothetical protein [Nonomuraea endophytica]